MVQGVSKGEGYIPGRKALQKVKLGNGTQCPEIMTPKLPCTIPTTRLNAFQLGSRDMDELSMAASENMNGHEALAECQVSSWVGKA